MPCSRHYGNLVKKILVSGDHILKNITPNIINWTEMDNALQQYLNSLDKIYDLDVGLVLPGHRSIWNDHRGRIRELLEHHKERLKKALAALQSIAHYVNEIIPAISNPLNIMLTAIAASNKLKTRDTAFNPPLPRNPAIQFPNKKIIHKTTMFSRNEINTI